MTNPFLKRATEYFRDDTAFLSVVTPEPLKSYFLRGSKRVAFIDRTVIVFGSPGSGKTTMAMLLEFRNLEQIIYDQGRETNRELALALSECGFIEGNSPNIAAVRLPMESGYRDFWELPYDEVTKTRLVMSLIQARAILALFRNFLASGRRQLKDVRFVLRSDAGAAAEMIGGEDPTKIYARAQAVERAIYSIGASLVAPSLETIDPNAKTPYQPFDVIEDVQIKWIDEKWITLRPLIILDDAHNLHERQFEPIFRELARREMKVARWIMMRLDTLDPQSIFRNPDAERLPGLKSGRDYDEIYMQSQLQRQGNQRLFRTMSLDMADRYLHHHRALSERGFNTFGDLLDETALPLTSGLLKDFERIVHREQKSIGVAQSRRVTIEMQVEKYASNTRSFDIGPDVKLAMTRILMHRYANRVPQGSLALFGDEDPEPATPLKPNSSVAEGARIHLHLLFDRPYHFGKNDLCDASDENAELFLQLAGSLVGRIETALITRPGTVKLTPKEQQDELRQKSTEIISRWNFPFVGKVKLLVEGLAAECLEETLKPNARLGAGANSIGILQQEMNHLLVSNDELANVLKFAIAYGALKQPVINYGQGGKSWCLLELSGPVCLKFGLTLKRGGFIERRIDNLKRILSGAS